MTIQEIYNDFNIPPNLQIHMLRVAALAQTILKNWEGEELNQKAVIQACLLHDIAKPLTFDLREQTQFLKTQRELEELAVLQKRLKDNYGSIEHKAAVQICQEVGCKKEAVEIMREWDWKNAKKLIKAEKLSALLCIYVDTRIAPWGLVSLDQRIKDLKERRGGEKGLDELKSQLKEMEKKIQENMTIALSSIAPEHIEEKAEELRTFQIN